MDIELLIFLNHSLAHPLLDIAMIALTTIGLALLPALGLMLLPARTSRRLGWAILASIALGLVLTLIFQYLALRPRPEAVRLLLPTPGFPSFPSGHTAVAFSVAVVIALPSRKWWVWVIGIGSALLIALSRVYLGHHYPSDILAGIVLGAAAGAACHGLLKLPGADWRWLLWPQIAIAVVVTQMAYLDLLPFYLLQWPLADKVLHFLLFGAVVFWLNLWFGGRKVPLGRWAIPLAILLPLMIAALEEGVQAYSPRRNADPLDLTSDAAGMLFFWWLSHRIPAEFKREVGSADRDPLA
jgi:undecaprenyl-diphosphatase